MGYGRRVRPINGRVQPFGEGLFMWETVETASEGAPFKYFNIHQKLINEINGSKLSSGQICPIKKWSNIILEWNHNL